jgi:hypothetical protein
MGVLAGGKVLVLGRMSHLLRGRVVSGLVLVLAVVLGRGRRFLGGRGSGRRRMGRGGW